VDQKLQDLAATVEDTDKRNYFLNPARTSRELVGVLRHLSSEARVGFFIDLLRSESPSIAVQSFLIEKLDNCVRLASPAERVTLLRSVLTPGATQAELARCVSVLESSSSFAELRTIVDAVGRDHLKSFGSEGLCEIVAMVEVQECLNNSAQSLRSGKDLSEEQLARIIDQAIESVLALGSHVNTAPAQEALVALSYNKAFLDQRRGGFTLEGGDNEFLEMMVKKLQIEWQYGVMLSHSAADPERGSEERLWTSAELEQVQASLGTLSEGMLLFTPWLSEIQRVPSLGKGVLGARFGDGTIRIADYAVDNIMVQLAYGGTPSLQHTLVHEIGHGVQIGNDGGGIEEGHDHHLHFALGEPSVDFDEFLAISGWEILHPDRVEVGTFGLSVKLDGQDYPTGVAIQHQGRALILMVVGPDLVVSHDAFGPFSLVPYSRTSPWEDFAEAFAEYHLQPERLIRFAPEKFKFFEEEYRKYEGRMDLER
jgi:hypothetical protein